MAVDKLVDSGQLDSDLTSIANAIRTKGGTSAQLAFPNGFVSAVNALPVPVTPTIQSLTVTPTTSQQTFDSSSVDGYKPVTVNAMPSGTAGTPTATKGAVSDHSVSVTPSVTNTTGYITGSTKTGTAVTVSASELVSGSETKTSNGTYDVTNLAQLIVNVSGGGSSYNLLYSDEVTVSTTSTSATDVKTLNTEITFVVGRVYCVSIRDKAGKRNGYFYGTDNYFLMPYSPFTNSTQISGFLVAIGSNSKIAYSTSLKGVYAYRFYGGSNMGDIVIRSRYDSSNTLTINGTYSIKVYEVIIPEPFE